MSDPNTTTPVNGNGNGNIAPDSTFFGISIRAWISIILVCTICVNHLAVTFAVLAEAIAHRDFAKVGTFMTIGEPLYSLSIAAVSFFFGQKTAKTN